MAWPMVDLGEVVSQRKEFITIEPDVTYSRCRVQTSARGIVLRDRVQGLELKTKRQQVCRAGDFLVAEIDAKLGGYGLVPDELEGAIVSSHYFLYTVDGTSLDKGFLNWYCRTKEFLQQVNARGSTNYAAIRSADVLNYRMPLPPFEEQRRIVARLDRVANRRGDEGARGGRTRCCSSIAKSSRLLHKSWHVVVTQAPAFSVARAWRSSPSSLSLLFIDRIALPAGRMMRPAR